MHGLSSNKKSNNANQNPWSWESWNGSVINCLHFYSSLGLQKSNNENITSAKHTYFTLFLDNKWLILSLLIIYRHLIVLEFSVPQIEYPLGGSRKKGSHVYFLLIVPWYYYCDVRLHYCDITTTFISDNSTIWQNNNITQKACNRKYTWLPFLLLPPSGYSIWGTEHCILPSPFKVTYNNCLISICVMHTLKFN